VLPFFKYFFGSLLLICCFSIEAVEIGGLVDEAKIKLKLTQYSGIEVQLDVLNASLSDILDEVSAKANIPIHYSILPSELISATCVGGNLDIVFQCLLGDNVNIVFHYPSNALPQGKVANTLPKEIWFMASSFGNIISEKNEQLLCQEQLTELPKNERLELLIEKGMSSDPIQRAQAIVVLAREAPKENEEVKNLLLEALDDESGKVRLQALIAWVVRKSGNVEQVLQQALQDESRGVRLKAVGLTRSLLLLQQVVDNESDSSVKRYAERRLKRLEKLIE